MGHYMVSEQTIQAWGNGLAMRITAPLAKAAHVVRGTPVTVEVVPEGFLVRVGNRPRLSWRKSWPHSIPMCMAEKP
jgi:antitoxin MazE